MDLKKAVGDDIAQRQAKLDILKAKILGESQPTPRPPFQPPVEEKQNEVEKLRKQVANLIESLREDYGCSDEEIQALLAT